MAEQIGVPQGVVSEYELGKTRVHGALVAAFAKALDASADEILGLKPPKENGVKDRRLLRRLEQIDKLPRRKKDALLTTIDAFLKQP